jgi:hypothetical protein
VFYYFKAWTEPMSLLLQVDPPTHEEADPRGT